MPNTRSEMYAEIGQLSIAPPAPATGVSAAGAANAYRQAAAPRVDPVDTVEISIPASPPEEVLQQVDYAAQVVDRLASNNRELHFSYDEHSKRVVVEVRDLEGNVLRTIPPAKALDVMSGAPLE